MYLSTESCLRFCRHVKSITMIYDRKNVSGLLVLMLLCIRSILNTHVRHTYTYILQTMPTIPTKDIYILYTCICIYISWWSIYFSISEQTMLLLPDITFRLWMRTVLFLPIPCKDWVMFWSPGTALNDGQEILLFSPVWWRRCLCTCETAQ